MEQDLPEPGHPLTGQDTPEFTNIMALRRHQQHAGTDPHRRDAADQVESTAENAETEEQGGTTHLTAVEAKSPPSSLITPAAKQPTPGHGATTEGTSPSRTIAEHDREAMPAPSPRPPQARDKDPLNHLKLHEGYKISLQVNPITTRPSFNAFWTFGRPKGPHNGLKMGSFHLFVHPKWSRMRFEKKHF